MYTIGTASTNKVGRAPQVAGYITSVSNTGTKAGTGY